MIPGYRLRFILFLLFAAALLAPLGLFAQETDGYRAYHWVARAEPAWLAWEQKEGRGDIFALYAGQCSTGSRPISQFKEMKCELIPVVTSHVAESLQDTYKKEVLDAVNHMPQQLKDELRKVAVPEIEAEMRNQLMSQIVQSKQQAPEFSMKTAILSALCGAVFGFLGAALLFYFKLIGRNTVLKARHS